MFDRLIRDMLASLNVAHAKGQNEVINTLTGLLNNYGKVVWDGKKYVFVSVVEMHLDSNGGNTVRIRLSESEVLDRYAIEEKR